MNGPAPSQRAGIVTRTLAYLVDVLLVAAGALGAALATVLVASAVGGPVRDFTARAVPLVLALLPVVFAAYNWFFWGLAGRTLGMALFGVRVVTVRGGRASWFASLVRAVVLAYLPIGALWSLVDRRGQALHDKLARTMVVAAARPGAVPADQSGRLSTAVSPVRQPQPS